MTKKQLRQAVVIMHGMGEQVPMETVRGFVDSVWRENPNVIDRDRPVQGDDEKRSTNPTWTRPDDRTGLYETRRITTEKGNNGYYTDFFEFYWAHLVHGTTWEQVRDWIFGLLFRNPFTRVPRNVRTAWIVLWIITLVIAGLAIWAAWPKAPDATVAPAWSLLMAGVSAATAWVVANVMVARFGDVVRYTKADPPNIARREEIRRTGVDFLNALIAQRDTTHPEEPHFDRIIVVAHSLGTIVAYDILSVCFAYNCRGLRKELDADTRQPARAALEDAVRHRLGLSSLGELPEKLTPERYQQLQDAAREELNQLGATWQVTDFVTLGSPLTHAEFLLAESREDLDARKKERLLATCPPTLEYDGETKLCHFTFRRGAIAGIGKLTDEEKDDLSSEVKMPRWPHHAAVFGYTRWTNIYSPHKAVVTGDLISGPLGSVFGIGKGEGHFCGIRDIAVMPQLVPETGARDPNHRRRVMTHNSYWKMKGGTDIRRETDKKTGKLEPAHHIRELRYALGLGRK
ncbi:hypothetical protein [Leisingera thetidis]|uniref:hypothetical protein n=1 Tax=Leisingera thetidis TaxID=2930199 RepID=UPI0021F777E4|nr:hypothetical protein [Leisingera thetidis]